MKTQLNQLVSQIQNKKSPKSIYSLRKNNKGLINQHTLKFYGNQL